MQNVDQPCALREQLDVEIERRLREIVASGRPVAWGVAYLTGKVEGIAERVESTTGTRRADLAPVIRLADWRSR